jgi:succinyl-diaminopimelate desuccinylase
METLVDPLTLTRNLLAFNTINPPGQEQECAKYLSSLLESVGFQVRFPLGTTP